MRLAPALLGLTALAFASAASAQTQQVSYSPEFQTALEEDIGVREGEYLSDNVTTAITRALERRGVAQTGLRIEVVIEDAQPNRFTIQQLRGRPGVDPLRSVSIGGAELRAVLRGADGAVVAEVEHRRYSDSLRDLYFEPLTWTDANRAIRQFAEKVADAYVAHSSAR